MIQRICFTLTALVMVSLAADLPESGSSCNPSIDSQAIVDPDDCTVFFKCSGNQDTGEAKWISSKCVDGTVYSAEKKRCDIGENACQGYTKPAPVSRDIPTGCESNFLCPQDLVFYIYPDWQDCTKYYVCLSGVVARRDCSAFAGLTYYSANDYSCVSSAAGTGYKEYVPPLHNVNIAPRAIRPGCERVFQCPQDLQFFIYPDWNNCSNYNTCVQGIITSESCLTLGFPWYNPSSFACEQQINLNNVCFFRA